jgi:hypothetical protein
MGGASKEFGDFPACKINFAFTGINRVNMP